MQAGGHADLPKDLQRLSMERMMRTGDGHAFGNELMMGSLSWFPSTRFRTNCFQGWWNVGSETFKSCA